MEAVICHMCDEVHDDSKCLAVSKKIIYIGECGESDFIIRGTETYAKDAQSAAVAYYEIYKRFIEEDASDGYQWKKLRVVNFESEEVLVEMSLDDVKNIRLTRKSEGMFVTKYSVEV